MGVRVVTDSSCDLPVARAEELGIEIVPLTIRFGDEEFVDRVELTNEEFWTQGRDLRRAARDRGAVGRRVRGDASAALADEGADGIVCINLSSRLSATMQSAQVAAKALKGTCPVEVVDSLSVSMGLGLQCINAVQPRRGRRATSDRSPAPPRTRRCAPGSSARSTRSSTCGAAGASAPRRRCSAACSRSSRSSRCATARSPRPARCAPGRRACSSSPTRSPQAPDPQQVFVFDAQAPDIDELIELLAPTVPRDQIEFGTIGPVIGTHAGPRTIGVGWVDAPVADTRGDKRATRPECARDRRVA